MSVKVANSRFITSSLQKSVGFYQQLLRGISGFQDLGRRLVRQAEIAQAFRQTERLNDITSILINLPIREYQLIGEYYKGWCAHRAGEDARPIFERVLEQSKIYKVNVLMSLGASEASRGNYDLELGYFTEALRITKNPSLIVETSRAIAVVKAKEGFHKQAVKDFENLYHLVRNADPNFYYQYLNSYAVELGEVGRIEEAQNICRIILASPYAFAYPEWRETWQDLALRGYKSRSAVRVTQTIPKNLLYLPEGERKIYRRSPFFQPSDVTSLADWKKNMVKEPNGDDDTENLPEDMTPQDMAMKILELITENKNDEDKIRELMESAIKIFSRK